MKKRIWATLLCLCLVIGLLPTTVLAATTYNQSYSFSAGTDQGGKGSALYWDGTNRILYLNNATINSSNNYGIEFNCEATIVLEGTNYINVTNTDGTTEGAIRINSNKLTIKGDYAGKLTLTTARTKNDNYGVYFGVSGTSTLNIQNVGYFGIITEGSKKDSTYGVWSTDEFTVNVNNSCFEVFTSSSTDDYANPFFAGSKGYEDNVTINLTNSSFCFKAGKDKNKYVVRKEDEGKVWVDGTDQGNPGCTGNGYGVNRDYIINYDANYTGGTGKNKTETVIVKSDGTMPTINHPITRDGYEFKGWNTQANGNGTSYSNGTSVNLLTQASKTINLYAVWAPIVTFDANGGTAASPATKSVTPGKAYGELANTSRTGYTFNGWFTEQNGGSEVKSNTMVEKAEPHTLYAHWTANKYTVTFNANGGSVTPESKEVTYDSAYGTLPTPTYDDHSFKGWYTASSGGTQVTEASIVTTADNHTLYAQWDEVPTVKVNFDLNYEYATNPDPINVPIGGKYTGLPTGSRTGYAFDGWYTSAEGGTKVTTETDVTAETEHTLYAHWTANTYTVSFDLNYTDATDAPDAQSAIFGQAYGTLPTVTRSGFTFKGWYNDATASGDEITSETVVAHALNHTLFAKWEENAPTPTEYTVTYYQNHNAEDDTNFGDSNILESTYTVKSFESITSFSAPTDYEFEGWYTARTGGDKVTGSISLDGNKSLYAHYKLKPNPTKATVTITKVLAGAVPGDARTDRFGFYIYATGNDTKTYENTVYVTGAATSDAIDLDPGTYYMYELVDDIDYDDYICTPVITGTGTTLNRHNDNFVYFTVAAGDNVALTVTNTFELEDDDDKNHDDDDKDRISYYFAVKKVDAEDGKALNGASFELYQLNKKGEKVNRYVKKTGAQGVEKGGIALFSMSSVPDGTWYYAETAAPEGYALDDTVYKISDSDFDTSLSKAISNAEIVTNSRSATPSLLNDEDHFAYVLGYQDGTVRPYGLITRAETTTIFFRLLNDSVRDGNLSTGNGYADVSDSYWANTAISTMSDLGIVQGFSNGNFNPTAPITRAQFAAICARFDTQQTSSTRSSFSDTQGHWAEKYIQRAAELGWIQGFEDGTFRPDTYITRAQAMTMINRVLNRLPETEDDLADGVREWPDCTEEDWFYLHVQEATHSHTYKSKKGSYETWKKLTTNPDWTRYEN